MRQSGNEFVIHVIRGTVKKIGEGKEEMEPLPEFLEEKSHYNPPLMSTVSRVSTKTAFFGLRMK